MATNSSIRNAFTVDVEDYFQVQAFAQIFRREDWERIPCRVEYGTQQILDLLQETGTHATFFTLGWIAERYPALIQRIVAEGHELASHGYGHQLVTGLTPEQFRDDVSRAKQQLEDTGGVAVRGYRAPTFSITRATVWAFSVLAECGYRYSSSIYPFRSDYHSFPDAPRFPFREASSGIIEIPITTLRFGIRTIPAGGGGYFRLYPYRLSRQAVHVVNNRERQRAVFYTHPWELDTGQPRPRGLSLRTRVRHYLNMARTKPRLRRLLSDFAWGRMDEVFNDERDLGTIDLAP